MNFGLGLAALDAYDKAQDAQKDRDYHYALQDADLKTLPDRTQAQQTGYQMQTANNKLGLDKISNAQANQPTYNQIANNQAQGALAQSNADLAALPGRIERAAVQGQLDQQGQSDMVLGTLGGLLARNDKDAALNFANGIAKAGNIMPNTNGKTFTDIQPVQGGQQGDGFNFVTSDGESRFVPAASVKAAMGKLKSGDYTFFHTGDGSVYSGNKQTGVVTQAQKGDPNILRGQHTPAEVQTMEWLMKNGVAKSPSTAWDMVRSAREKTRNNFVLDYVGKNAAGLDEAGAQDVAAQAGKIYDSLRSNQGYGAQPQGRSPNGASAADRARQQLGLGNAGSVMTDDPQPNAIGLPSP